jgi:hypothetical protein
MKVLARSGKKRSERGIALILAIFTLMLISVIGTALILTAGTVSAIKANYKSSMQAFYDSKAGLEEGRSRLLSLHTDANNNADAINSCVFPTPTSPMPTTQVCYIINPAVDSSGNPTETVNPTDLSSGNLYADREYAQESLSANPNVPQPANSDSPVGSISGPAYKWVRVTPTTEKSSGIDVNGDGWLDPTDPLFYGPDGHQYVWTGVGLPTDGSTQVLTVTALAVTPSGGFSGTRLLQYTVTQGLATNGSTPSTLQPMLPAALTLDGNGVTYSGSIAVNGQDSSSSSPSTTGVQGIAYTNSSDPTPSCSCQSPTGVPGVGIVTLPDQMQTPQGLNVLVNTITQDANVVLTGPTDQSSLPSSMSPTNPMIVVVNGDFHLTHASGSSPFTGYGLLLVTGTLYYDPDDTWNGVILVIGKGVFDGSQNGHNGQINGAVFVANTLDSTGKLLSTLGPASYKGTGGGGGLHYGSNWVSGVNSIESRLPYQVLSFREIQTQ